MRGIKTGGRKVGTLNKRKAEIVEKLAALGCDPIEGMAIIALDGSNTPELRGKMFAELAQYVAPKRRAIEHSGDITHAHFVARIPEQSKTVEEWNEQHKPPILIQ